MAYLSMQGAQGVLLFLVLVVNSTRFRTLRSCNALTLPTRSYAFLHHYCSYGSRKVCILTPTVLVKSIWALKSQTAPQDASRDQES